MRVARFTAQFKAEAIKQVKERGHSEERDILKKAAAYFARASK
jgi:transposase-like protein